MNDADERFASRLADEIRGVLGPTIELDRVVVDRTGPTTVIAECVIDGDRRDVAGEGPTLLEASQALIRAAAELRLADAWTRLEASS